MLFRVKEGSSNRVDLANISDVITTEFPGPTLTDGTGTTRVHIEEGARANWH